MSKVRINDLARELEVKSRAILDVLDDVGVTEKKTHSSSLELDEAERVRAHFQRVRSGSSGASRAEAPAKPKIDWSRVSKPGDVLKAIQQKRDEAAAPPPRPAAPPVAPPRSTPPVSSPVATAPAASSVPAAPPVAAPPTAAPTASAPGTSSLPPRPAAPVTVTPSAVVPLRQTPTGPRRAASFRSRVRLPPLLLRLRRKPRQSLPSLPLAR